MTHHDPLNRGVLAWMLAFYLALAAVACAWIAWRAGAEGIRALVSDGWAGAALGAGMAAAGVAHAGLNAANLWRLCGRGAARPAPRPPPGPE